MTTLSNLTLLLSMGWVTGESDIFWQPRFLQEGTWFRLLQVHQHVRVNALWRHHGLELKRRFYNFQSWDSMCIMPNWKSVWSQQPVPKCLACLHLIQCEWSIPINRGGYHGCEGPTRTGLLPSGYEHGNAVMEDISVTWLLTAAMPCIIFLRKYPGVRHRCRNSSTVWSKYTGESHV